MDLANNNIKKIAFVASARPEAQQALKRMHKLYGVIDEADAQVIVALGGDGLMLETLRRHMNDATPVFGLNRGTIGFLMNEYSQNDLIARINAAKPAIIHPLKMVAIGIDSKKHVEYAINEVSLLRQTHQTARLSINIDNSVRMQEMICDGIIVATSAGSTAYNFSAHGPILPIGSGLLAITPISVFRPRRWRGALVRDNSMVKIVIHEPKMRPVAASADNLEVRHIREVEISLDRSKSMVILFDSDRSFDDRVLSEQFAS